jgi:hypothetical protein
MRCWHGTRNTRDSCGAPLRARGVQLVISVTHTGVRAGRRSAVFRTIVEIGKPGVTAESPKAMLYPGWQSKRTPSAATLTETQQLQAIV